MQRFIWWIVGQWRKRLRACQKAQGHYSEHLANKVALLRTITLYNQHLRTTNSLLRKYVTLCVRLFNQCFNSSHCLSQIFTPVNRSNTLNLRERGHPFELLRYTYNLTRKSFVMRALYECIWVPLDRTVPLLFTPVGSNYMPACKYFSVS